MRNLFLTIAALTTVFFPSAQQATIKNVNSTEFKKLITKKDGILLDVRTLYEFKNGHLKEADQLNYYSFSFKDNLLLLPKNKPIYVYCKTGYRSKKTAEILIKNGYTKVYNLQYGIKEWKENNFPIVKDTSN
ncbi:rhodanese-like domain-containing protein [Lutibacter citreus]|uniref:rhodanese-like domain-containing protein n=1 Tax=Lutibacter citreus TaxID=2138210 RepID=UPI000DBE3D91|nr:rhodanese-like domain-containing protein [Lutibacter citreus]